ncbi:MAG: ATP-binding protein [Candidatus Kapaibacterium sp.]
MPHQSHTLIARVSEADFLRSAKESARATHGRVLVVKGESGFGKSLLMQTICDEFSAAGQVNAIVLECEAPIGKLSVSSLQTMQPFVRALEALVNLNSTAAKKRLAMNIGLSVLGLIPFAGAIFDMTKEVMRDLREYRREQEKAGAKSAIETVMNDLLQSFIAIAAEKPFVLFLDEAHRMDAESFRFLSFLQSSPTPLPFSVVVAIQQAEAEKNNPACMAWLNSNSAESSITLGAFDADAVRACVRSYFPGKTSLAGLDDWLLRRTAGVPIAVCEYLEYFSAHSPFKDDGNLDIDVLSSQAIPASLQALLSRNIDGLSEHDANLLAMCSAEGREFSVFVIARLMNTDVLSALRELKSLQFRTGLIRSTGPQPRYGMKTTVYEFSQAVHHALFYAKLEHEERVELHDRIAHILRECFDASSEEQLQQQLAPYIAAHALEAGDEDTARAMLMITAQGAADLGYTGVIDEVTSVIRDFREAQSEQVLQALSSLRVDADTSDTDSATALHGSGTRELDAACYAVRDKALDLFLSGDAGAAAEVLQRFCEQWEGLLSVRDFVLLYAMRARCESVAGRTDLAADMVKTAQEMLLRAPNADSQCILDNVAGTVAYDQGKSSEGLYHLQQAARAAASAGDDCRLLTVTNIAFAVRPVNQRQYRIFHRMAHQLCSALHYHEFRAAILEDAKN